MLAICLVLPIFFNHGEAKERLGCKNMKGKDVDWFVAIKLPRDGDELKGRSFVYFDSTQNDWEMSKVPINSSKSAIGATISQIYKVNQQKTFTIAYNDDSPVKEAESGRGHSKGVAAFDSNVGFWMLHSVPNFPPVDKYDYPESGTIYAQSFLCLSLSTNALEEVAKYMRFATVTPFLSNLPAFQETIAPTLTDVVHKRPLARSATVFTTISEIKTLDGKKARGFSKHKRFVKDLWHDFIAPNLKTTMAVETWRKGNAKNVGSICDTKQNVYDVNTVSILGKSFPYTKDHSKWGVSMSGTKPIVCIGDVNRQMSQYNRGGGAVCIEDSKLWKTFNKSVKAYDDC